MKCMVRPPIWLTAWVLRRIHEHLKQPGSFRYLIYDRMGYGPRAYLPLYYAGGMEISNAFVEVEDLRDRVKMLSAALGDAIACCRDDDKEVIINDERLDAWKAALHGPNTTHQRMARPSAGATYAGGDGSTSGGAS
jgi:hypothetical protein